MTRLLDSLREAGAETHAAALATRLPGAGMFGLFLGQQGPADQFRWDGRPTAHRPRHGAGKAWIDVAEAN